MYKGQINCENNIEEIAKNISNFLHSSKFDFNENELIINIGQMNDDKKQGNVSIVFNIIYP